MIQKEGRADYTQTHVNPSGCGRVCLAASLLGCQGTLSEPPGHRKLGPNDIVKVRLPLIC